MTIEQLEAQGYEVWVDHYRYDKDGIAHAEYLKRHKKTPLSQGGLTLVEIRSPKGKVLASGNSKCSKRDNFNKKLGRTIALGRAVCELTGEAKRRRERESES